VKLLIVDDSALARLMLKGIFENDPDIQVIGEAVNGEKGVSMTADLRPDVVIMDVNMPVLDGIEATRKIMSKTPVPILIFTSAKDTRMGYLACQAGAVDVLTKPGIDQLNDPVFMGTLRGIILSLGNRHPAHGALPAAEEKPKLPPATAREVLVIGASTGGPKAVRDILSALPDNISVPMALVQHMETGFDCGFVEWLQEATTIRVTLLKNTVIPEKGNLYVAPCDRHLVFEGRRLVLDDGPRVLNQKPAVDRLFSSAAAVYGNRTIGVLLTGMGQDGARGCVDIIKAGGATIVEDASTAAIFGMPKAAIDRGGATKVTPLGRIALEIGEFLK
jgi:two-component system chemotaxis response regulator CheB